ncbi:unnamed protein product [Camellia sinensis]
MNSSSPENLSSDRKKAIKELVRGRELTNQLLTRLVLGKPHAGEFAADELVVKIMGSFSETIMIILNGSGATIDEAVGSPSSDGRKSEDSGESSKCTPPAMKDRRGCYKRRKTSQTWTRETPTLIDDGHAWRKYGQKVILNAKHPRNYFRCTHKFDQGCQATKQVQLTEDEPPMYRTTYHGFHTCKNPLIKSPHHDDHISLDSGRNSVLLNFGSNSNPNPNSNHNKSSHNPYFPTTITTTTTFPLIKQEYKEDQKPSDLNPNQLSASNYFWSPDLAMFESSGPLTGLSSGSDHGDVISSGVYSCTASTHSHGLDMDDMMVGAVDFADDVLQFEF